MTPSKKKKKNEVNMSHFQTELSIFAIFQFSFKNHNFFCPLLTLLSGDFSLYPRPFSQFHLFKQADWWAFSNRGLHLIHLNINSLLSKIGEWRDVAKRKKAAVTGISESKLVLGPKIYIENDEILCFDINWHGKDVARYIRSNIS